MGSHFLQTFAAAVQASRILKVKGSPELKLYGLYQQATEGDITTREELAHLSLKFGIWSCSYGFSSSSMDFWKGQVGRLERPERSKAGSGSAKVSRVYNEFIRA